VFVVGSTGPAAAFHSLSILFSKSMISVFMLLDEGTTLHTLSVHSTVDDGLTKPNKALVWRRAELTPVAMSKNGMQSRNIDLCELRSKLAVTRTEADPLKLRKQLQAP
jgi:hypothetical protein